MLSSFTGIVPDRTQYEILLEQRGVQIDPAIFEQVLNPPGIPPQQGFDQPKN